MGRGVPFATSTQGYVTMWQWYVPFISVHDGKVSPNPVIWPDILIKANLDPFSRLSGEALRLGKFPGLFLEDTGKNTISWWRTHRACACAVFESLCKSRDVILSGLETPWMDYPVWAVGLPSGRSGFSPSTVIFLSLPRSSQNDI